MKFDQIQLKRFNWAKISARFVHSDVIVRGDGWLMHGLAVDVLGPGSSNVSASSDISVDLETVFQQFFLGFGSFMAEM